MIKGIIGNNERWRRFECHNIGIENCKKIKETIDMTENKEEYYDTIGEIINQYSKDNWFEYDRGTGQSFSHRAFLKSAGIDY